jgi:hypothetical protein
MMRTLISGPGPYRYAHLLHNAESRKSAERNGARTWRREVFHVQLPLCTRVQQLDERGAMLVSMS